VPTKIKEEFVLDFATFSAQTGPFLALIFVPDVIKSCILFLMTSDSSLGSFFGPFFGAVEPFGVICWSSGVIFGVQKVVKQAKKSTCETERSASREIA
jgi:hypothetical protein